MTGFVSDAVMLHDQDAARYDGAAPLVFDLRYRFAQLPLIDPSHPRALASDPDGRYDRGTRPVAYSLAIPVRADALWRSAGLTAILDDLKGTPIAGKIDWALEERRRGVLHATIAGTLPFGAPPEVPAALREAMRRIPPFSFQIRRLFLGAFNTGRIYLCLYPEAAPGGHALDAATSLLGIERVRRLYCGFLNLKDELAPDEARLLQDRLDAAASVELDVQTCRGLAVFQSFDDLVLRGGPVDVIRFGG